MKKVLIIAYAFPPYPAIGAQRPFGLAKYLPRYGWEPIVLTSDYPGKSPEGIQIIKARHYEFIQSIKSNIKNHLAKRHTSSIITTSVDNPVCDQDESKLMRFIKEIMFFPDEARGWYNMAVKSASKYLNVNKVDAIISTSSPETDHLIGKKIKQRYRIPWIADLRDPWTQNTYRNKFPIVKYFEKKMEVKTLAGSDAIVTVSEPWIRLLGSLHQGKKIYCIPNGYDENDFELKPSQLTRKFTITYAGSLYKGKRDPSLLFAALDQLLKEKKIDRNLIEVRFYGPKEAAITEQIRIKRMDDIVHFYGKLARKEVLSKLMESQLLLLLLWNHENEDGFCPGKMYEYFGARRPIIAIGWSGSVVKNHLEKTGAGQFADSPEALRTVLLEYYGEFSQSGAVRSVNSSIESFSYASIARKYSEVLNSIV